MWTISLCLYNASYGVLVWKAKLLPNSDYTAVADNFHVFALGEVDVLIGLTFSIKDKACELCTTYTTWNQERARDDGKKGFVVAGGASEPVQFRKDMISKPCNFQHIQGTQAIDECMDIEKIKSDIIASFFGMGTKAGRSETDARASQAEKPKSRKKKKEAAKPRLEFREISLPHTQQGPLMHSGSPLSPTQEFVLGGSESQPQEGIAPREMQAEVNGYPQGGALASNGQEMAVGVGEGYNQQELSGLMNSNGVPTDAPVGVEAVYPNHGQGFVSLSQGSSGRGSIRRGEQPPAPNYQNPISPDYQEYNTSQGSYSCDVIPSIDLSLEKEFAESALFKSSIMTAN